MKVLNFGSLNLDYVYAMDEFVQPGETRACLGRPIHCGGKGFSGFLTLPSRRNGEFWQHS